jgi:hypothetical protein
MPLIEGRDCSIKLIGCQGLDRLGARETIGIARKIKIDFIEKGSFKR